MFCIEEWNDKSTENPLLKYLAFVKTAEKGSFARAAQELNYVQSSVSKMVADLEQEWGMTLLERSKSGVCLTSAGAQLMPFLRKILNDHREMESQICRMNGIETGIVRIGTFSTVAIHWLPNLFAALQKDYPGIEYEMLLGDYDEVEQWIYEGLWTAASCASRRERSSTPSCSGRMNIRSFSQPGIRSHSMRRSTSGL